MKKANQDSEPEMRASYKRSDFGVMVRGKYADRVKEGTNVVLLEPDVAKAFPNDKAVNEALRMLMDGGAARPPRAQAHAGGRK
ncbi:MAG: hypothetical protein FJY92_01250 [Candidatus Hydrogenedentes bacterium]|nr:hypothetical protein [Candidatus Hydrogenedentota bacterium]